MATDYDLHSNDKARNGQRPPRRAAIPFDSGRRGINVAPQIVAHKLEYEVSWPGLWPRSLVGAGPIFLLGTALLCTVYAGLNHKKSTAANPERDEQLRSSITSQPSSAVRSPAEPSPIPLTVTAQSAASVIGRSANAMPSSRGFSGGHSHAMKYEATHKKVLGGCTGQLELTIAGLHFRCAHEADLDIPVTSIASTHKDGVVLASGEKYHFLIANHTKGQVEMIFNSWLNRVRQSEPASGELSYEKRVNEVGRGDILQ